MATALRNVKFSSPTPQCAERQVRSQISHLTPTFDPGNMGQLTGKDAAYIRSDTSQF